MQDKNHNNYVDMWKRHRSPNSKYDTQQVVDACLTAIKSKDIDNKYTPQSCILKTLSAVKKAPNEENLELKLSIEKILSRLDSVDNKNFITRIKNNFPKIFAPEYKDFISMIAQCHPEALKYLPESYRNNNKVLRNAIYHHPESFQYASDKLKNNKKFVIESLKLDSRIIPYLNEGLLTSKEIDRYSDDRNITDKRFRYSLEQSSSSRKELKPDNSPNCCYVEECKLNFGKNEGHDIITSDTASEKVYFALEVIKYIFYFDDKEPASSNIKVNGSKEYLDKPKSILKKKTADLVNMKSEEGKSNSTNTTNIITRL